MALDLLLFHGVGGVLKIYPQLEPTLRNKLIIKLGVFMSGLNMINFNSPYT